MRGASREGPATRAGRLGAWIERHLVAAALAEEGVAGEALCLRPASVGCASPRDEDAFELDALLRARGVRMFCGVLSPAALSSRR